MSGPLSERACRPLAHPGPRQGEGDLPDDRQMQEWEREQHRLAARVLAVDAAPWLTQPPGWHTHLTTIGGLDMSFTGADPHGGCGAGAVAALAVLSFPDLRLLHRQLLRLEQLPAPYLPGFLGFREAPAYLELLQRAAAAGVQPQLLLVDGFGLLHPRRCGSASHLGVLCDVPTVGVAKHLLRLEGVPLCERQVRAAAAAAAQTAAALLLQSSAASEPGTAAGSSAAGSQHSWRPLQEADGTPDPGALWLPLTDAAGDVLGAALSCTPAPAGSGCCSDSSNSVGSGALSYHDSQPLSSAAFRRPVYVSAGHRVSLASALAIVRRCCLHRVPEPIRQADLLSRAEVRRWQQQQQLTAQPG